MARLHASSVDAGWERRLQAQSAIARGRSDVLFAMLRDGTLYQPHKNPETALAA